MNDSIGAILIIVTLSSTRRYEEEVVQRLNRGLAASLVAAAAAGAIVEVAVIRRLYKRDHLDQVLATFALILIFSEGALAIFGARPLWLDPPAILSGAVTLPGGADEPTNWRDGGYTAIFSVK